MKKNERIEIMLISLAQALKEKKRLVGEIAKLWQMVQHENARWENQTRTMDPHEALKLIDEYTLKLIELKTKIGKANEGNLANIYALEEYKSQINRYEGIETDEEVRYWGANDEYMRKKTVLLQKSDVYQELKTLQLKCNRLQDELDEYNATHKIEFDTPLR